TLWSRRGSCRNAVGAGTKGRREHSPAFPFAARSIVAMPLVLGLLGGVAIALATVLIEHSRIEFGRYALYGNGAFAVPAVGVPLALYSGWTELARSHAERARRVAVALFTAGACFGVVAGSSWRSRSSRPSVCRCSSSVRVAERRRAEERPSSRARSAPSAREPAARARPAAPAGPARRPAASAAGRLDGTRRSGTAVAQASVAVARRPSRAPAGT